MRVEQTEATIAAGPETNVTENAELAGLRMGGRSVEQLAALVKENDRQIADMMKNLSVGFSTVHPDVRQAVVAGFTDSMLTNHEKYPAYHAISC